MAIDEYGGYYYNGNPQPRWGQGQQFASQQACFNSCVSSGDAGCGACSYMPPTTQRIETPATPPPTATTTTPKTANDDIVKYFIIGGIILLLLSWS